MTGTGTSGGRGGFQAAHRSLVTGVIFVGTDVENATVENDHTSAAVRPQKLRGRSPSDAQHCRNVPAGPYR
jgi:hypothetical protein